MFEIDPALAPIVWARLAKLPQLRRLRINTFQWYRAADWAATILKNLTVDACSYLPDRLSLPRLELLNVRTTSLQDDHLVVDVSDLPELVHLQVSCMARTSVKGVGSQLRCLGLDNYALGGGDGLTHGTRLEALSLNAWGGSIQGTLPQLRAVQLSGCRQGILTGCAMPSLTQQHSTFNPCMEFVPSLSDTVDTFMFIATNKGYTSAPAAWLEPLVKAKSLTQLLIAGTGVDRDLASKLKTRGLRRCEIGRNSRAWANSSLVAWDPEQLFFSTRSFILRSKKRQRRYSLWQ